MLQAAGASGDGSAGCDLFQRTDARAMTVAENITVCPSATDRNLIRVPERFFSGVPQPPPPWRLAPESSGWPFPL